MTTATEHRSERGVIPTWTLGDRIRKSRELAELSQQDLADELTVARQSVNNWENGRKPLRIMVREIARITGVDEEWLVGGELVASRHGRDDLIPDLDQASHISTDLQRDTDIDSVTVRASEILSMCKPLGRAIVAPEIQRLPTIAAQHSALGLEPSHSIDVSFT